ncbi:HET-domain-containing protein, partial [Mollisia scopiformis]
MASSSQKTIPYRPLDPSRVEIRVISMSPDSNLAGSSIDSPISISLHIVSLNDPSVSYFALSYVWGDASNTTSITVDGAPFAATANLAAALRVFRTTFGGQPNKYLWVDAVCINQDDMPERIAQVELMGRIYRQTSKVLVWLGPGDDHVCALFTFLRVWSKTLQIWIHPIDTFIEVFVDRPYWSRTWTFQELQLPEEGIL